MPSKSRAGRFEIMRRLSGGRFAQPGVGSGGDHDGSRLDAGTRRCRGADRQVIAAHGGQRRRHDAIQLAGLDRAQRLRHAERRVPPATDGAALVLAKYYNSPMPHAIFFYGGFAIHGTYELSRLGGPASHGCVRLNPSHAATLFSLVERIWPQPYADRDFELNGLREASWSTTNTFFVSLRLLRW